MIVVAIIFAYLLGSISSSFIAGRLAAGVDIRDHGSGNAGATNTLRVLGWKLGVIVLIADAVKGVLAVAFAHLVTNGWAPAMAFSGLAAIVGHDWPVYHGFRGGKGVATTIGVLLTLSFLPALYAGIVAILVLVAGRYVSVSALVFFTLAPIFQIAMHADAVYIVVTIAIAILGYWRHRENIDRLRRGRENRVSLR